jgi:hypothetical protein
VTSVAGGRASLNSYCQTLNIPMYTCLRSIKSKDSLEFQHDAQVSGCSDNGHAIQYTLFTMPHFAAAMSLVDAVHVASGEEGVRSSDSALLREPSQKVLSSGTIGSTW